MSTTVTPYTPAWQVKRRWTHEWSRSALFGAFAHLGLPRTLLDVGCGEGHLVELAARLGIYSVGVDVSLTDPRRQGSLFTLLRRDLTVPLGLEAETAVGRDLTPCVFDLVLCWEVAEHLPPAAADQLVDTLATYAAPAGTLVFTAAYPGQGGTGHVNEQPPQYWRDSLVAAGFTPVQHGPLRDTWTAVCGWCQWYPQNLQVFRRREYRLPAV